jgi:hypothetical protein
MLACPVYRLQRWVSNEFVILQKPSLSILSGPVKKWNGSIQGNCVPSGFHISIYESTESTEGLACAKPKPITRPMNTACFQSLTQCSGVVHPRLVGKCGDKPKWRG